MRKYVLTHKNANIIILLIYAQTNAYTQLHSIKQRKDTMHLGPWDIFFTDRGMTGMSMSEKMSLWAKKVVSKLKSVYYAHWKNNDRELNVLNTSKVTI